MNLRIGTRRSRLALAQANEVADGLRANGHTVELVPIVTSGDRGADPSSDPQGLKGLFVVEIVRALRAGEVDLAVHSAKDLPADDTDDLVIGAVPPRSSPLDVLVTRDADLTPGARVGTSSVRRQAQIFRWRPDVLLKDVRGNVDTRLRKLADGEVDALVLAAAGLLRLGIVPEHVQPLSVAEMTPAPGQGALAVQARADDGATLEALVRLDHAPSRAALTAERGLMLALGGGCALPLGAFAEPLDDGRIRLVAIVLTPEGARYARTEVQAATPEEVAELARLDLAASGADEILASARERP
ncbi:MAG TPA: hydroxymethylbilane synthase [Actinomycetota bacterium]|nr:hydroxymethylbilane synthase [Actinomycetota bacterium]